MVFETDRLRLREFVMADWAAVLAYQTDARYQRYYPVIERDEAQARAFVAMFLQQQGEWPRLKYQLAITLRETGQLIGNCGVRMQGAAALDADIGYELAPAYWGRGYATEAAAEMMAFGFEQLGVRSMWADCVAENVGSRRVLEKLGMRLEIEQPEQQFFRGRWWGQCRYTLQVNEWANRT